MTDRSQLARQLLEFLERSGVAHCVVGDTRGYLAAIASDVDLVVGAAVFPQVPRLIAQFCREHDVHLVQLLRHEQTAVYFVLAWAGEAGELRFLAADLCSDYLRGGRRLLTAEELLAQRRLAANDDGVSQGFWVPAPHMQFIYYLLKKIDKLELDDRHGEYLASRWRADPGGAYGQIGRFWRSPADAELLSAAAAGDDWASVRDALPRLRRTLHRAVPRSFAGALGELSRRAARVLRPTGLTVAFLGPDGSGKSSVIERVLEDLAPAFRRTRYLHLRPRLVGGRKAAAVAVTAPHALPARGHIASLVKLAYLVLDYVAGYALRVRPLTCRSTLVVFDRHYRDLLIDPRRYRYGGSMALARLAALCVPGPDLWLLLDAPAEVLQARKQEVPADESERQRGDYLEFVDGLVNAVVVDASRPLAEVASDAEHAICRFLQGRLEFRHPQLQLQANPLAARLLQFFCRRRTPVLSQLFRIVFNSDIHCRIHAPLYMPHPYGIVVHGYTVVGSSVTLMQQVTLGSKDWGKSVAPVIEDNVYIGSGAKVLGAVRVGRGATIGANAVVTRDVPPHCTVVGANRVVRGSVLGTLDECETPSPTSGRLSA